MSDLQQEIIDALQMESASVPEAQTLDPADSPLNQPVIERDIPEGHVQSTKDEAPKIEVPTKQAEMMAEVFLGAANNVIAVGGGFFVKIKKHDEFYQYEELVQIIEEQNQKNVRRLKLDEDDRVMLKPLIVAVLKKRAKVLSPEEQLAIALFSILIKKAQVVMEIRAENEILVQRFRDIIQEQNQPAADPEPAPTPVTQSETITETDHETILEEKPSVHSPFNTPQKHENESKKGQTRTQTDPLFAEGTRTGTDDYDRLRGDGSGKNLSQSPGD